MEQNQRFVVGIVRNPHGLTGKFKVESTSGETEHFSSFTEVTLKNGDIEKTVKVESVSGSTASLLMKCTGIDTPEDAAKYRNWEMLVPRDKACPLKEGEFYVEDLKQCSLVYSEKNGQAEKTAPIVIGTITGVTEGGGGKLLEVTLTESSTALYKSDSNERFIPFRKEFIGDIDLDKKTVELMHLWILE